VYRLLPEETTANDARPQVGEQAELYYGVSGGTEYTSTTEEAWQVTGADIYGGNH